MAQPTATRADRTLLTGTWQIDTAHSTLGFSAKHAMVTTVRGRFTDFSGTLHLDGSDPTASTAEIDVALSSVDTGNTMRDDHIRNNDFLAIDEFPTMTFRSTAAELGDDDGEYRLTGALTIRGVTRPVTFDLEFSGHATDPMGNERVGFEGHATINRKDWGVNWNVALEAGGFLVSEKVKITLDISAIRQA
jgi:polyisoprenoid-binding protein YceI